MVNLEVINEKLLKITTYINELKEIKPDTFEEYKKDIVKKYAIERLIQLIIDLALDINNIILSNMKKPPANDYFNSFIDLIELDILDHDFAYNIAPSTGLRNRLVHEYESINDKIVYESIDKVTVFYSKYVSVINRFVG
ncbi:MAG: hypothetical protein PWQ37_327 [Candidatus Petromonas sp.]|jgi:uncharacterized protein YutE (UPF0331/DUF86 family)|nr:hypothetical protein [Candidatus Petromonas sp.]